MEETFAEGVYVGRVVQHFGSDGYQHKRFGAHPTGLKTKNYEWSAAIGWAHDSDRTCSRCPA